MAWLQTALDNVTSGMAARSDDRKRACARFAVGRQQSGPGPVSEPPARLSAGPLLAPEPVVVPPRGRVDARQLLLRRVAVPVAPPVVALPAVLPRRADGWQHRQPRAVVSLRRRVDAGRLLLPGAAVPVAPPVALPAVLPRRADGRQRP